MGMKQIFLLGSSNVYGVGGVQGGWADLVKQALHKKMFTPGGIGEKYEIFNFGKSGVDVDFVIRTFPQLLKIYGRGIPTIAIVSVGGNNAKAQDRPDNFVCTVEEYALQMTTLIGMLKKVSNHVIIVDGAGYYDESKTNPKINPFIGGASYFTNKRKILFATKLKEVCTRENVPYVEVNIPEKEWVEHYLYEDGLHPNQKGYELIASKVLAEIEKLL